MADRQAATPLRRACRDSPPQHPGFSLEAPPQLDKRRASGDYTRGKGLPAARGASALLPLAVPLDKYLLREATARDAGFLEVRDKSTPEEQARQEALNRQRERLLAKRADDRHRARQRALEEAKATKEAERSYYAYPKKPRTSWVLDWPGMVILAVDQIFWTRETEEALIAGGLKGLKAAVPAPAALAQSLAAPACHVVTNHGFKALTISSAMITPRD